MIGLALVPLTPEESGHEARVVAHIRAELAAAGGWLPFSRYMELALYAPGLGYYAAGAHKLGAGGDFVTDPVSGASRAGLVAYYGATVP